MNSLDDLERQARALSTAERARLAELLLESIQPPVSTVEADWNREIEARVAAFDRGAMRSLLCDRSGRIAAPAHSPPYLTPAQR